MMLAELIRMMHPVCVAGDDSVDIRGLSYDSRKAAPGHLFIAMRGEHVDGHDYIGEAVRRGAVAVVYDRESVEQVSACLIRVPDTRAALAAAAHLFFEKPSDALTVVGITGTNGKTTTTYLVKSILEAWGKKVGLIGTIHYLIGSRVSEAKHTTPEALEFQGLLQEMRMEGCSHVISEVSSHALAQRRVDGTRFAVAVFTNLTRDHLDFHGTMEEYFRAKKRLFAELLDQGGTAIINNDDPYGRRLIAEIGRPVLTFGLEGGADLTASDISSSFRGTEFRLSLRGRRYTVFSPMIGLPNVYNVLAAAAIASVLGVPWEVTLKGVTGSEPVKGRFERIDAGQKFLAVVDYAHTEDALERLIYTARGITRGRVIIVFGCGGDRDRGKRPTMGAIATRLADAVIFTSDNPRSEDPGRIISEIAGGATRKNYLIEPDRREAVARAVRMAGDNDVVLLAGKGHEAYQEIAGTRHPFDDREVLREAIAQFSNNH